MCDYEKLSPDNSVKFKLPTGFSVINMKVFQCGKVKIIFDVEYQRTY